MVMAWRSVSSPHCDLCDGPHATILSWFYPVINHPAPVEPDACNSVCSCCGFHWLQDPDPFLSFMHAVSTASPAEVPSPLRMPRPSLFRPPRIAVSSIALRLRSLAPANLLTLPAHGQTSSGRSPDHPPDVSEQKDPAAILEIGESTSWNVTGVGRPLRRILPSKRH
jgi:hypothetical protein